MGELPSLNRYRGESLDELIAMEGRYRTDSIVLTIHQVLLDKQRLSEAERTVIVIEALEREVNNGGFHQLFLNVPHDAVDVVEALRRIGSPEIASLAQEAIDALRLAGPPTVEAIEAAIARDDDDDLYAALDRCDEAYYQHQNTGELVENRLFEYIKANRGDVSLSQSAVRW
jgi:hypothetical protein